MEMILLESLVIGFCICRNCGWTSGKFNWHTYFRCPECGCKEYIKPFERSCWNEDESKISKGTDIYSTDGSSFSSELCI